MYKTFIFSLAFLILSAQVRAGVIIKKPEGMDTPPPQIAASPSRIELEISDKPANSSVKLFNLGDKAITVNTTVQHWDMDEFNRVRVIEPTPQSLDQWMIINPIHFTIAPGKSQTVRLSIRPNVQPDQGEHRGIIYFKQELPEEESGSGISVNFRLGIVVYGLAGTIVRSGELKAIRFKSGQGKGVIQADVLSTGNSSIRLQGQYSLWRKSEFPGSSRVPEYELSNKKEVREKVLQVGRLSPLPVLAGARRTLSTSVLLPRESGNYILFLRGKLEELSVSKEFAFTVSK
jgi:fimbrial chaperone protein